MLLRPMRIDGINYELNWQEFKIGSSFFVPCLAVTHGRRDIVRKMKRLKYAVIVKIVVEDGIKGLRVWRIPRKLAMQPQLLFPLD